MCNFIYQCCTTVWFHLKWFWLYISLRNVQFENVKEIYFAYFISEISIGYFILVWRNCKDQNPRFGVSTFFLLQFGVKMFHWLISIRQKIIPSKWSGYANVFSKDTLLYLWEHFFIGTALFFSLICIWSYVCVCLCICVWTTAPDILMQTPCLSCVYQGRGRRESSFPTWHISIKEVKTAACVRVWVWRAGISCTL